MVGHQELYIIAKRNLRVCERKRSEVLWSYFHGKYKALTICIEHNRIRQSTSLLVR